MIAILGKGFISCLISSNNQNLQLLSFQKIYTLLGFYETCDREAATSRGCHLGYTDTLKRGILSWPKVLKDTQSNFNFAKNQM